MTLDKDGSRLCDVAGARWFGKSWYGGRTSKIGVISRRRHCGGLVTLDWD